jgi:putative hydroxymethylpyrimidine transport system ATP-binding protein
MTVPGFCITGAAYSESVALFAPLDFRVPAGQWTCLLGPSGIGKSTLLRLVAQGQDGLRFDGQVRASDGAPLAGRVAMMAQDDRLLPWLDCLGNLCLGARLRGQKPDLRRAASLLDRVGLRDLAHRKPDGLSGGQRQRVALARTLMEDCPILLLDEPFSALDARTKVQIQDLAAELLSGRTVLMVTHDPSEAARMADHLALLGPQGITWIATPPEAPPRLFDAAATLALQAALQRALMAA